MASESKEKQVLQLILEQSPLKEWHFEEIVKEAKVTKAVANKWLKKYVKSGLLSYVKEKGKFAYYTVGRNNSVYYSLKRIYALEQFHECGLIPKLISLQNAKTIIIFGSMIKGDWYKESDIDIFVFGEMDDFDKKSFERKLKRNIELHVFQSKIEIKQVKTGLTQNIINGYIVKGQIQDIVEVV